MTDGRRISNNFVSPVWKNELVPVHLIPVILISSIPVSSNLVLSNLVSSTFIIRFTHAHGPSLFTN